MVAMVAMVSFSQDSLVLGLVDEQIKLKTAQMKSKEEERKKYGGQKNEWSLQLFSLWL